MYNLHITGNNIIFEEKLSIWTYLFCEIINSNEYSYKLKFRLCDIWTNMIPTKIQSYQEKIFVECEIEL